MPCPICNQPAMPKYRPFCSRRCADLDLGRWMNGAYRVPLVETDEDLDDLPDAPTRPDEFH